MAERGKMKITIDKRFTSLEQAAKVKKDIKEFKVTYTENDLLNAFSNQADRNEFFGEIIKTDISAFSGGYAPDVATQFCVTMITEGYKTLYKIRFYVDMNMNVNMDDLYRSPGKKLYTVEAYRLQ